ncbi:hypothetical protein P4O66_004143, partial [Electrophorus voltai]
DPDLDAAPPRASQLIQQPQALANPPPYPQPGTSLTPKLSPYDELRRQLEAITSPVAHRTRSHTTIKPSAEPEVDYAPQFPMVEVSGPEGVIMVHRHWTADDIMKAADGLSKPEEEEEELKTVPAGLWAQGKNDVGLIKGCEPVHITPKSDYRPHQHQYPLKPEAVEGIRPVFQSLKQAGVIVPCPDSPVRTPIFPVKKPGRDEWRFVQDLQAVNAAVHPRAPEVPNPHTILSQIPPDTGEGSSSRGDEYATPHPPT